MCTELQLGPVTTPMYCPFCFYFTDSETKAQRPEVSGVNSGLCDSEARTLNYYTTLHVRGMFPSSSIWPRSQGQKVSENHAKHQPQVQAQEAWAPSPMSLWSRGLFLGGAPTPLPLQAPRSFSFSKVEKPSIGSPPHPTLHSLCLWQGMVSGWKGLTHYFCFLFFEGGGAF